LSSINRWWACAGKVGRLGWGGRFIIYDMVLLPFQPLFPKCLSLLPL
jgi:hypothetical protein